MRVGVDARHLAAGRGVAHYTSAMLQALAARHPQDEWVAFAAPTAPVPAGVQHVPYPLPSRVLFGAGATIGRPRLDRMIGGALDVVWVPAVAPLALSRGIPLVLTVHDLSFEDRPGDFTPYERLWHRLARPRELARRAARVLVVSESIKLELIERWSISPELIDVAAPGISARVPAEPVDAPSQPYLLAVGALEPRKAPELLARAFRRARASGLQASLVFAGEGRLAGQLEGQDGVVLLGRVSDGQLETLYGGALALVNASLLEGFGLTPLEALARGVPAIVTDLPVYAETLGGGAMRFAAGDEESLAGALLAVARDPELRRRLVFRGNEAVRRLSRDRAADSARAAMERAAA